MRTMVRLTLEEQRTSAQGETEQAGRCWNTHGGTRQAFSNKCKHDKASGYVNAEEAIENCSRVHTVDRTH